MWIGASSHHGRRANIETKHQQHLLHSDIVKHKRYYIVGEKWRKHQTDEVRGGARFEGPPKPGLWGPYNIQYIAFNTKYLYKNGSLMYKQKRRFILTYVYKSMFLQYQHNI